MKLFNFNSFINNFWKILFFKNQILNCILFAIMFIALSEKKLFAQTTLAPGDVAIVAMNPSGTDAFAFVLLKDINANTVINFTDNGFASTTTGRTNEGYLTYTAPSAECAGTVITWTNGMNIAGTGWSSNNPSGFNLNATGDQLFAFQGTADNSHWSSQSGITLLYGVETQTTWITTGTATSTDSYNPSVLASAYKIEFANTNVCFSSVTLSGTPSSIITALQTIGNFTTSNSSVTFPSYASFSIIVSDFSALSASVVCTGNNSAVTVNSTSLVTGDYTVTYNLSGTNASTGNTAIMSFTAGSPGSGTFTTLALANSGSTTITITSVKLNSNNCAQTVSGSNTVLITVILTTLPTISAGSSTTFCTGCSVILTSSAESSYLWSTGATTQSITVSTSGSYTVRNQCGGLATTTVTVNSCSNYVWTGATSSDLTVSSNWNKCSVPGATDDVTIASVTTAPVINTTVDWTNLTINFGATLTNSSGNTLNVYGNIVNNGTYSDNGTTVLKGSGAQTVTGTISFNNLTIDNSFGVTLNNITTVKGILTLTAGTLASGGNLRVNLNTGAIAGIGSGAISGNITTFKTVNSSAYHMISSPLSSRTANQWSDNVSIGSGVYANFYSYDETNTDTSKSVGWVAQTSTIPLTSLIGFAFYFTGAATLDETGTYTHSDTYSGSVTNTATANADADGWNLMGNPYPSALDWDASGWTKTDIDDAIYLWDPVNNQYTSYVNGAGTNGGTQYIPSMQAFWVRANVAGSTGTLGVNNNARVTSINPAILRTAATSDMLRLKVSSGSYNDETVIRFNDAAQETFDASLDAYKMQNEGSTPSIYTVVNNNQYSINSLPYYTSQRMSIPVSLVVAFTGNYIFTASGAGGFADGDSVIFEDRLLGIFQDLKTNPTYTSSVTLGDVSGRFFISFKKAEAQVITGVNNSVGASSITVTGEEDAINIKFLNESSSRATIGIYNALGQKVFKVENADISGKEYTVDHLRGPGVYIVKVITTSQTSSKKVYLLK